MIIPIGKSTITTETNNRNQVGKGRDLTNIVILK